MGVMELILVYLVNQNFIAGSADSSSINPNTFSTSSSQSSEVVSTSSPQTYSACVQNEIISQSSMPSQGISFVSPQNSKYVGNSLQLNENGCPTSAPKASSPLNLMLILSQNERVPDSEKPPTVNELASSLNIAEFQNERLSNSHPFENSMSPPSQNNVFASPPQSDNCAQESLISPSQLTISSQSHYRGKPSTLNIVNTIYDIDNFHNSGGSNSGAGINENKQTRPTSNAAVNSISLATQSGLNVASSQNSDTLNECANGNRVNRMVSGKQSNTVSLPTQNELKSAQSSFNLNSNSEIGMSSNLNVINGNINIARSQSLGGGHTDVSTNCPTVMAHTDSVNSVFATPQNSFVTVISSPPQSSSCSQDSQIPPSKLTHSPSKRKVEPGKPFTLNIINSNLNVPISQNSVLSSFDIATKVTSDNFFNSAPLLARNNMNNMVSSQPTSANCDQGNIQSSAQFMSLSLNPYSTDSGKQSTVNFFPTDFNISPIQTQENLSTGNGGSQSTVSTSTGSVNLLTSPILTLPNSVATSAGQTSITNADSNSFLLLKSVPRSNPSCDSLTGTKINNFSTYMTSLNQVPNPLPSVESIPLAKPCLSSISDKIGSLPSLSPDSALRNNLENNGDYFLPTSSNYNIQNSQPPSTKNIFFLSQNTICKDCQSEEVFSERKSAENLKAQMSPIISSNTVQNSDQLHNINIPCSLNNNNYPLFFSNNLYIRPSCSAKSNNIQPNIPNTVNIISPSTLSPLSSILSPIPITISQNSYSSSQKSIPVSLNLVKPNLGSETKLILPSSSALNPNSPVSLSSPSYTLPNTPNELFSLSQSQPSCPPRSEIDNKFAFPDNLNQQLPSRSQLSFPCTVNVLSPPSSSASASSQSDNPLSLTSVCNCKSNTLTPTSGMGSTLISSNTLSSNSPLSSSSSCTCNTSPIFPKEGTTCNSLIQALNTPCIEYKNTHLLPASNFNQEQPLACGTKSKFPHTVNIISPNIPSSVSFIPSSVPSVNSQNTVSVCNCQTNTPGSSNLQQLHSIQGSGKTCSLSFLNTLNSLSSLPSPCVCDQLLNTETPKQHFAPNLSPVLVPNNVFIKYDQPSSYPAHPPTYQQLLSLTNNDELTSFNSVSNPAYTYCGSVPIRSNPYSSNVAVPSTILIPNTTPTENLSLLSSIEKSPPLQPIVPVNYITSPFSSPVLDSYNTWVPSLVESLLAEFDPDILLKALCQDQKGTISPCVSRIISSSNSIDAQTILESLLQDPQCDLSPLLYPQNYPLIIDNEPVVLDTFPWQPTQFIDFTSDYYPLPIYEQFDFSYIPSECLCDDYYSSSSYTTYPLPWPPQIIIDDNGSIDSDSAEEFLKWIIFCELCNRCNGLDPFLALAVASCL